MVEVLTQSVLQLAANDFVSIDQDLQAKIGGSSVVLPFRDTCELVVWIVTLGLDNQKRKNKLF